MNTMNTKIAAALALSGVVLLLAGCTAPADPAEETPAPSAAASVPPGDTSASSWVAPQECLSLDLTPDATIDGAALGGCVSTALSSHGSGREHVESSSLTGEIAFQYSPDFQMSGEVQSADGPMTLTYVDATMWIDRGDGPVKGDVTSSDPEEQLIGFAGEMYRIFSDPAMAADLIAAGSAWIVGAEEDVELGNGETIRAFPIVASAPFSWNEIPVQDSLVWFAADWTPVGVRGTVSMMGVTETTTQTFYDLGEPVEITPIG